jgi:tRNA(Ile)-lysidine synthase TilS/MesJ
MKVRCKICGIIKEGLSIKHYNIKLCFDCFPQFFIKRVQNTIEKFKMFNQDSNLIVAISGGKDSMSLAKALKELGYKMRAFHMNVNISEVSQKSQSIVENFCNKENIPLKTIELYEQIKASLEDLSKISGKPVCSVCGMMRRYFINKEAQEEVIVTGHTLNDEVSFILKNILFWNDELLARVNPVLQEREGLSRKVKPLCLISEEETLAFCKVMNIEYVDEPCPNKPEIYDIFKTTVKGFNDIFPGSIAGFYKGWLKRSRQFYASYEKYIELKTCQSCGYPTTSDLCSVCRLKEKLIQYEDGRGLKSC